VKWFYAPEYDCSRGVSGEPAEVHVFVLNKTTRIREELIVGGAASKSDFVRPETATGSAEIAWLERELRRHGTV
jgi:hypothetical protein